MKSTVLLSLLLLVVACGLTTVGCSPSRRAPDTVSGDSAAPPAHTPGAPLPDATVITQRGNNRQGFEESFHERSGLTLILIPGGQFRMGSVRAGEDAGPAREVTLSPYFLSKYEVSNAQYARFCRATARAAPEAPLWQLEDDFDTYRDHPVVNVSWEEASAYCEWAGLVLPTEAQWEFAARGPDGREYPWGSADPTGALARFDQQAFDSSPLSVSSFSGTDSPFGTVNQAGNVWEWCADRYADSYRGLGTRDPQGASSGWLHVIRGGGFGEPAEKLRGAHRHGYAPGNRLRYVGFRPARVVTR